jgi:hypothetical protein
MSVRAHYFKLIEHEFEFSLNLHLAISEMPPHHLDLHLVLAWRDCFGLGGVCLTSLSIKVLFLFPAKVSGQHIPKKFSKKQG